MPTRTSESVRRSFVLLAPCAFVILAIAVGASFGQEDGQEAGTPPRSASGAVIYELHGCSDCHGENGEGGVGPALAGDVKLWNDEYVVDQILFGGGGMPAFRHQLSDEQVANVATYVRTSWGNRMEEIGADYVTARRESFDSTGSRQEFRASGSQLFAWNCMICHGVNGGGGVGPALAGNPRLADGNFVVAQIQLGGGGMPPFAPILSSREVAAVASYVREAWGNELGEVSADHVRVQWEGLGSTEEDGSAGVAGEAAGAGLYAELGCAGCHSSEGAGGIGPPLDGNPSLTDGAFVLATIRDGRKGMPAFGPHLTLDELQSLASYVRTAWSNDFGPVVVQNRRDVPPALLRSQADPVDLGPEEVAGESLFGVMGCAGCHSSEGAGGIGPPLNGNSELAKADYVVDTILTGGEQMPAYGPLLTDEQVAAVASYVRGAWQNDYPNVEADTVALLRADLAEELDRSGGADGGR